MRIKPYVLIALALILPAGSIRADDAYSFKSLQVEDGLSQSMVYCITQDSKGFMWFGTQDGLNRYDGKTFKIFKKSPSDSSSIGNNNIMSLLELNDGRILTATLDGIYVYDPVYETFRMLRGGVRDTVRELQMDSDGKVWALGGDRLYLLNESGIAKDYSFTCPSGERALDLRSFCIDGNGTIWIATYGNGIFRLNPKTGEYTQLAMSEASDTDNDVNCIFQLDNNTLLIGTVSQGVLTLNTGTGDFSPYIQKDNNGNALFVRKIFRDNSNKLWFCTETGVIVKNLNTGSVVFLKHRNGDPYSIADNAVHSIYQDREGGIWLGTYFGGVNYYIPQIFHKFYPEAGDNSISGKSISEFCDDHHGHLWIGTEDAGLNRYDLASGNFESGFVPAHNIHSLMYDDGDLWVGSFSDGLFVLNTKTLKCRKVLIQASDSPSLLSNTIYAIYKDRRGTIWVGTMGGLYKHMGDDKFERVRKDVISGQINNIVEDSRGVLWVSVNKLGILAYNPQTGDLQKYSPIFSDDIGERRVLCIMPTAEGNIWFGTDGSGFFKYDISTKEFNSHITTNDGLRNDVVNKLVQDAQGLIWGSTNSGLFRYSPKTGDIVCFTYENGLIGNQFNVNSGILASDGRMYFGGINGFVSFAAEELELAPEAPSVVVSSLKINGKDVKVNDGKHPILDKSIIYTDVINIPSSVNNFNIGLSKLGYMPTGEFTFRLKLSGYDKDYINLHGQNTVTYSNLKAGKYYLMVDGEKRPKIEINIVPPFYASRAAYILYALLVLTALALLLKNRIKQTKHKNAMKIKELEMNKEKEIYDAKMNFFTNVTHEIRTPLSLIKMPLEAVMENTPDSDANKENLLIIQNNADRLLTLVNELLDFRKIESGGIKTAISRIDVIPVTKAVTDRFVPSLEMKGAKFISDIPESLNADLDAEIYTKIISNLMNNALKHCKNEVGLKISSNGNTFRVDVYNDGDSIPKEYSEKIFHPFFKIEEKSAGSGIGLAFSRSLAKILNGSLSLEDSASHSTLFSLVLPIEQKSTETAEEDDVGKIISKAGKELDNTMNINKHKVVLLVEDNDEFRSFVASQLNGEYDILEASSGEEALKITKSEYVDVIVSDLMMPGMSGMELCEKIRQDVSLCHLPFIVLTANTSIQSKLEGMEAGADEYIEKPFSVDFLKARIKNLLESRNRIIDAYKRTPEVALNTIAHNKSDENFLNALAKVIYDKIDDVDLDVDTLAEAMNMSRATLYRKVGSISDLTPNDFIRLTRLKKAAELLKEKEYRVNEIAYIVGFKSSSYFTKCFYKQFGVLPKDFGK